MICPLVLIAVTSGNNISPKEGVDTSIENLTKCMEIGCAWWIKDGRRDPNVDTSRCAIAKIAERIGR